MLEGKTALFMSQVSFVRTFFAVFLSAVLAPFPKFHSLSAAKQALRCPAFLRPINTQFGNLRDKELLDGFSRITCVIIRHGLLGASGPRVY